MAQYKLNLADDTVDILMSIGQSMGIPASDDTASYLETTIAFLADSVDSQMEVATAEPGNPISMGDAIDAIMNPDISTEFKQPAAAEANMPSDELLTLDYIKQHGGMHGKSIEDPVMQEAVCIVYTQLDEDEWDTPAAEVLVDKTYKMLQASLAGGSPDK